METTAASPCYFIYIYIYIYIFQYHTFIEEFFQSCHIKTLPPKKYTDVVEALVKAFRFPQKSWEVCFSLGWTMANGVNRVATQIRNRNHKYITLMKELIFNKARVWSLGIGIGRSQAPNPTQPVRRPSLIVFQILISLNGLLTCDSNSHTL